MAIGDAAAAAGMALVDGAVVDANTLDTEDNRTRDYIANGMGATANATANKVVKRDASGRAKFAAPSASTDAATKGYVDSGLALKLDESEVYSGTGGVAGLVPRYDSIGRLICATPSAGNHAASKYYVDSTTAEISAPILALLEALAERVAALEAGSG